MSVASDLRRGITDRRLLQTFLKAQEELIRIIESADPSSPYRSYRAQQLRAIEIVIRKLGKRIQGVTSSEIPRLVKAGSRETAEQIRSFGERQFGFSFAGVDEKTIQVMTDAASMEFGSTVLRLRQTAGRALIDKRKLQEQIIQGVVSGESVAKTQRQLETMLRSKGLEALRASNGRRIGLEAYANTLVRSQSMTAYNTGAKLTMLESGRRYAKIPKLTDIDGEDVCNEFERQVYIDLTDPKQVPPWHPNCRHVPIPVSFEELQQNRPDLYRKAVAYYRDTAGQ